MPLRSPSYSIKELIRNLASADRSKVEAARARLTILNGRSVESLVEVLEGGNDRLKLQAMPILALIRDGRAREPLIALLMDRDSRIREAAAKALSRFATRETILRLEKVVKEDPRIEVRVAAVQALVAIFDEGHEEALRELLGVLFDPEESRRIRLTAFAVVPLLSARERRGLLHKLREDSDRELAAAARRFVEGAQRGGEDDEDAIAHLASDLASPNYQRWNDALHRLIACGSRALPAIIAEMRRRHRDPEYVNRASMALKGLGPRRLRPVIDYLPAVVEPLPLEILVDVVASIGDKPLVYRLRDLIVSLDQKTPPADGFAGPDPYARVRGKAHLALARIGSRLAVADLKKTLGDPVRRIDPDMLTAAAKIGTRQELPDLIAAYRREDPWMKANIREVYWQIVRREKIRHRGALFESLSAQDRHALDEILDLGRPSSPGSMTPMLPGLPERPPRP